MDEIEACILFSRLSLECSIALAPTRLFHVHTSVLTHVILSMYLRLLGVLSRADGMDQL
jgi:hypothetical protein